MGKILLYYWYTPIEYPHQIMKWQRELCDSLNLRGRIIIAHEGLNGTVGGTEQETQAYIDAMHAHPLFEKMPFKTSDGNAADFPKLSVKIRTEICGLGQDPTKVTVKDGGTHLTPEQAHELMEQRPDDLVILDTRNDYEIAVGTFRGAINPQTKNFREFPEYIDKNVDKLKDKKVLMTCTGGVRCERASAYLKQKGIKQVYQLEGGIHCYAEKYPDGHFRGKNYVFDKRVTVKVNDDILGSCYLCNTPCDDYINCKNITCNKHFISCTTCKNEYDYACSKECHQLLQEGKVRARAEYTTQHEAPRQGL